MKCLISTIMQLQCTIGILANCFSKHLKQNIIVLNVKIILLLLCCIWKTKRFCISLVSAPVDFLNIQNGLKLRKIWCLKIKKVLVFSSKKLKQNITNVLFFHVFFLAHLLLVFRENLQSFNLQF
jgi:hypothetical protein